MNSPTVHLFTYPSIFQHVYSGCGDSSDILLLSHTLKLPLGSQMRWYGRCNPFQCFQGQPQGLDMPRTDPQGDIQGGYKLDFNSAVFNVKVQWFNFELLLGSSSFQ